MSRTVDRRRYARLAKPLSDAKVKHAKADGKMKKLFDGHGLYLEVQPSGAKFWRFRYRQANGKETTMGFGPYPDVSLVDARNKRTGARRVLLEGGDPLQQRDQTKRDSTRACEHTFSKVAIEWHSMKQKSWSSDYAHNVLHRLEMDIFPAIGKLPIDEVARRDLIDTLRKIEARGAHEIAKRNKAVCGQVFSYAIQTGVASRNPVAVFGLALE